MGYLPAVHPQAEAVGHSAGMWEQDVAGEFASEDFDAVVDACLDSRCGDVGVGRYI